MLYLKGVAQLDLGFSYRNHVPVLDLIVERLPATFLLMSCAFVFSIVLGVLLGVVAAKARYRNKRRWIDSSVMTGAAAVRHAAVLAVADGHPAVLGGAGLAAGLRHGNRGRGPDGLGARRRHRAAPGAAHRDAGLLLHGRVRA